MPRSVLSTALLLTLAAHAAAQTVSPAPGTGLRPETRLGIDEPVRQGPVGFQFYASGSYDFDADLDTTGESSVSRFGAGAGVEIEAAPKLIFRLAFFA